MYMYGRVVMAVGNCLSVVVLSFCTSLLLVSFTHMIYVTVQSLQPHKNVISIFLSEISIIFQYKVACL